MLNFEHGVHGVLSKYTRPGEEPLHIPSVRNPVKVSIFDVDGVEHYHYPHNLHDLQRCGWTRDPNTAAERRAARKAH